MTDEDGTCHAMGGESHRCGGKARWVTIYYDVTGAYAKTAEGATAADEYRYCRNATLQARSEGAVVWHGRYGFDKRQSASS